MILPKSQPKSVRIAIASVPEHVDWMDVQVRFPARNLDELSPHRKLEHAAVAEALRSLEIPQVQHNQEGKPWAADCSLSISHAQDVEGRVWAAVVVGKLDSPLGIDIERPRPQLLRVAPRIFSDAERASIALDLPRLSVAWNIKEAAWKAFGPELDYREDIEAITFPDEASLRSGATMSVRIRNMEHPFFVAQLPHDLSMAVGPLPQD